MLTTNDQEILIYYNPESINDRKILALAETLAPYVQSFAYDKADLNETNWEQILELLGLSPKELLKEDDPYFEENLKVHEFDLAGWVHIIQHHPELIKGAIAIRGDKAILCTSPSDIYHLNE